MKSCTHINDLVKAEIPIIKRHLEKHKWYKMIDDKEVATADFIKSYGFIMREYYCQYICKDKECDFYKSLIKVE
jgi:hypothetical protein